jgi:class 3 adenylate cyclase
LGKVFDISTDYVEINASFIIADLAGYTSLTEVHGDLSAADIISRYIEIVKESLKDNTTLVDKIGDEILITSSNTDSLLKTAIDLFDRTENEPDFPSIHIGLHAGKVIKRAGKYFGHTLNLTSRICSYSRAGQILCSQEIIKVVENTGNYNFLKIGDVQFKNVTKSVAVYEIIMKLNRKKLSIDSVCKMQVDIDNPPAKIPYKEKTYFFCSYECSKKFINNPEDFIW